MRRQMVKVMATVALLGTSWFVGGALAANITATSRTLASGNSTIGRCDTDGVSTVYNLTTTNVTGVIVSGINAACAGASMKVTVNNQAATSSGTGVVLVGGGSLTVTVTSIAVTDVMQTEISVI
jgi:hypothetical protein